MNQSLLKVKEPKKYDIVLVGILVIMALTSFVSIYSAFALITSENPAFLLMKQIMWYGLGFIVMAVIMYLGNDVLYNSALLPHRRAC